MVDEEHREKHPAKPIWLAFVIGVLVTVAGFTVYATLTRQLPVRPAPSEPSPVATPEPLTSPPVEPASPPAVESPAEPQKTVVNLAVNWNPELVKVDLTELGWTLPYALQDYKLEDLFTVYHVGTLRSGSVFGSSRLLLVERWCGGPCGVLHYRVIEKQNPYGRRSEFFILKNLSNVMEPADGGIFLEPYSSDQQYDIFDLRLPATISVYHPDLDRGFTLEEEQFSPAALFKNFVADRPLQKELTHLSYGTLYEDVERGYFISKLPDHTVKLYQLALPGSRVPREGYWYSAAIRAELTLTPPTGEPFTATYQLNDFGLCPPFSYSISRDIESRLAERGTLAPGVPFFEPANSNDEFLKKVYEYQYYPERTTSYEDFLNKHPVIFWKDPLERFVKFTNVEFEPAVETECSYFNSVL